MPVIKIANACNHQQIDILVLTMPFPKCTEDPRSNSSYRDKQNVILQMFITPFPKDFSVKLAPYYFTLNTFEVIENVETAGILVFFFCIKRQK